MTIVSTYVPATESQLKFIAALEDQKDLSLEWVHGDLLGTPAHSSTKARRILEAFRTLQEMEIDNLKKTASRVIDALKDAPRKNAETVEKPIEDLEGMHSTLQGIYKVQKAVHGSGRFYAKQLVQRGEKWVFEYAPGAIRNLSADSKMSLGEAKAFGALYGTCAVCARTLTDEESIERGIGPVCANRF